ncbi:MAG: thioesterase family protein [Solirubrobacterales bacterium]
MTPTPFTHQLRVRYSECDAQGIVFNANWFLFVDVTMTEFWRHTLDGYMGLPKQYGVEVVMAQNGANFRSPAYFDDVLTITAKPAKLGNSSLRMEFTVKREDELLWEAFAIYVFVDAKTMRPTPIPDDIRAKLESA